MGTFKKLVVFLIALLCCAVFVIGVFGVLTQYGDTVTVYVHAAKSIAYGSDFGNVARILFVASDAETELSDEQLEQAKTIMEHRLTYLKIHDATVSCDYENKAVLVELPMNSRTTSDFNWLLSVLSAEGSFRGVIGSDSAGEEIFNTSNVQRVRYSYTADSPYYQTHSFDITLDKIGREILKLASADMVAETEATETPQSISLWYGDTYFSALSISKEIRDGRFITSVTISAFATSSVDETAISEVLLFLNSGQLPTAMKYDIIYDSPAGFGVDGVKYVGLALACGLAGAMLYLIVRYRMVAFIGLIGTLGSIGFTMFFITGFMISAGISGTTAALSALAILLLLILLLNIRDGSSVRAALAKEPTARAVPIGLKATRNLSFVLCILFFLLGVVFVLCGYNNLLMLFLHWVGIRTATLDAMASFGQVLVAGSTAVAAFNVFGTRLMLNSLVELFKKPALYGGGHNA